MFDLLRKILNEFFIIWLHPANLNEYSHGAVTRIVYCPVLFAGSMLLQTLERVSTFVLNSNN